jgi:hypothetical protein
VRDSLFRSSFNSAVSMGQTEKILNGQYSIFKMVAKIHFQQSQITANAFSVWLNVLVRELERNFTLLLNYSC